MMELYKSFDGTMIEANLLTPEMATAISVWCNGVQVVEHDAFDHGKTYAGINVPTMYGIARASEGDWIIKWPNGDFSAVKPNSFKEMFEPIT